MTDQPPPTFRDSLNNLMAPFRRVHDRILIAILKLLIRMVRALTALVKGCNQKNRGEMIDGTPLSIYEKSIVRDFRQLDEMEQLSILNQLSRLAGEAKRNTE